MRKTTLLCDRCGAEVNPFGESYITTSEWVGMSTGWNKDKYDLCPKCFEELKEWLNKKKDIVLKNDKTAYVFRNVSAKGFPATQKPSTKTLKQTRFMRLRQQEIRR